MNTRHWLLPGWNPGLAPPQIQQRGFGLVQIVDSEVRMELLWHVLTRPLRRLAVINPLEADEHC